MFKTSDLLTWTSQAFRIILINSCIVVKLHYNTFNNGEKKTREIILLFKNRNHGLFLKFLLQITNKEICIIKT